MPDFDIEKAKKALETKLDDTGKRLEAWKEKAKELEELRKKAEEKLKKQ